MSDLSPTSDLTGPEGEQASKAASENMQQKTTEAVRSRRKAPKATEIPAEDSKPADEPTAPQEPTSPPAERAKVYLSAAVYKNPKTRKSFTVHLIQQKLNELGYAIAYADRDGYFGDLTATGVAEFQRDKQIEETGRIDAETLNVLFEGDERVEVIAD